MSDSSIAFLILPMTFYPSLAGFGIGIGLEAVDALLARFHPLDLLLVRHHMKTRSGIEHQIV
jgi:hypothetical protein